MPRDMAEAFPALQGQRIGCEDLKIPTKHFQWRAIFLIPGWPAFDKRKQVTVRIQLYDRLTLVA
jgi:hypothetical protein